MLVQPSNILEAIYPPILNISVKNAIKKRKKNPEHSINKSFHQYKVNYPCFLSTHTSIHGDV